MSHAPLNPLHVIMGPGPVAGAGVNIMRRLVWFMCAALALGAGWLASISFRLGLQDDLVPHLSVALLEIMAGIVLIEVLLRRDERRRSARVFAGAACPYLFDLVDKFSELVLPRTRFEMDDSGLLVPARRVDTIPTFETMEALAHTLAAYHEVVDDCVGEIKVAIAMFAPSLEPELADRIACVMQLAKSIVSRPPNSTEDALALCQRMRWLVKEVAFVLEALHSYRASEVLRVGERAIEAIESRYSAAYAVTLVRERRGALSRSAILLGEPAARE